MKKLRKQFHGLYWRQMFVTAGMVFLTLLLLGASFFSLSYNYARGQKSEEIMAKTRVMSQLSINYLENGRYMDIEDLRSDPDWQDRTLDRLCWLSTWLLERGICHEVRYLEPASGVVQRVPVSSSGELDALVERLLRTPRIDAERSLAERSFPDADWRYHITGAEGETAS